MDPKDAPLQTGAPADRPTFYRMGAHGLVELVDAYTGAVVAVQESMDILPPTQFITTLVNGKEVMVQSGVESSRIDGFRPKYEFNAILADVIVQKIAEGAALSKLAKTPGFPDAYTIARWRRLNPEFDEKVRYARQVRAEMLRDEAVETARSADGELADYVAGKRLSVDTLKWAAEKDDPGIYGASNKLKVEGSLGVVQLIVETGIRRGLDDLETREPGMAGHTDQDAGLCSDSIADDTEDGGVPRSDSGVGVDANDAPHSGEDESKAGDETDASKRGRATVSGDRGFWTE